MIKANEKISISALEEHTGYWLRCVSNHVTEAFARKLATKDATVAEWVLLRLLYAEEPLAPSHVARQMGMTKGAITKLVNRLAAKSLVLREASTGDGRAQTLRLTDAGRCIVPVLAALADQNDAECFDHLPPNELKALRKTLRGLSSGFGINSAPIE